MYTAFTKEIDGLTVILGLDKERLDPTATNKKIKPLLETSSEFKAKAGRLKSLSKLTIANDSLMRSGRRVTARVALAKGKLTTDLKQSDFSSGDQNSLNKYASQGSLNKNEMDAINSELPEIEKNLKAKRAELQKSHGVFFELTNDYENPITDSEYDDYSKKLAQIKGKKMFLTPDGKIIKDDRNKTFYSLVDDQWEKKEIKLLSEKVDLSFKLFEDLTDEEKLSVQVQFEADRIEGLTPDEKTAEMDSLIHGAVSRAGTMRNELEIIGDSQALVKAQAFYQGEKERIEGVYS